jgi:hypothetical protein
MSQQINLLLPELRPRFNWLALPIVLAAAVAVVVFQVVLVQVQSFREARLKVESATMEGELLNLQQQVQLLGRTVAERKPSADLPERIAAERAGVAQRRQVLQHVEQLADETGTSYSDLFAGLANQAREGVWLVGFVLAPGALELKGRMLDPNMLPSYIDRLNGEVAFAGRRFAALEMTGVDPAALPVSPGGTVEPTPYTEFVLRTELVSTRRGE